VDEARSQSFGDDWDRVMRAVFILVPSFQLSGPVKGAIALANALAGERPVVLVARKRQHLLHVPVSREVTVVHLADSRSNPVRAYRALLAEHGGRAGAASISFCLSADIVNRFCDKTAVTCASVRGDLPVNYRLDYGIAGLPLAIFHLRALRRFDHVVAMTAAMAQQIRPHIGRDPVVIGNFIDEARLEPYRRLHTSATGPLRFVFVGSLTVRKQPILLIDAIERLWREGVDCSLDMVGSGSLLASLRVEAERRRLTNRVFFHGQLVEPYPLIAAADAMVLPSIAEGISRSALEALHLGIPCVMRATPGNAELIRPSVNGALFDDDGHLAESMLTVAQWSRARSGLNVSLLPTAFRQQPAARAYLRLVESEIE
jgi:glycosyltransferase involved in cell wall biosynthesis